MYVRRVIIIGLVKLLGSIASRIATAWSKSIMGGYTPIQNLLSGIEDYDWYIQVALNDLTPQYFEDVMRDLRVTEAGLAYQIMGLSMALIDYIEIDEAVIAGELSSSESVDAQIEDIINGIVEDFLAGIEEPEAVCKNFWNGYDLGV